MTLCQLFRIDTDNVELRKRFLRLGAEESTILAAHLPWAEKRAGDIAREFYDWQFAFAPTRRFFEGMASKKGIELSALRAALESAQSGYFVEIFRGASTGWGPDYLERRLGVGQVHDRIDLPLKWYVGSYTEYSALARKYLEKDLRSKDRERVSRALEKVFNLDLQAVCESYLLSIFSSMGLRLDRMDVPSGCDLSEIVGQLKSTLRGSLQEIAGAARSLQQAAVDLQVASGRLTASSSSVAAASEEMNASIQDIAKSSAHASQVANQAVVTSRAATEGVERFGESSREIGSVVELINAIAGQTNLLALNATIEAARAGEAGKGFAVVAGEVKELSQATTGATEQISSKVLAIQENVDRASDAMAQVSEVVGQIQTIETTVAAAVEEQSAVVQEIARSAAASSSIAEETQTRAQSLTQLAARLQELTANLDL